MRDAQLTSRAKAMRRDMPEPERRMWHQLRAERFERIKFRRQKVIGNYIADFAANEPMVVVEIDGDTHGESGKYDARRTRFIEDEGYRVIRFSNVDVMTNMDGVLLRLAEVIGEMLARPPLPTLSPEGERAL